MTFARIPAALVAALFVSVAAAAERDALKQEAIARVAASHDPAIPIAIGRVYIKQAGLAAAREMLAARGRAVGLGAEWNPVVAEWQEAEARMVAAIDAVMRVRLEDPVWFRTAWGAAAAQVLTAEEADEIASHFESEGGRQQRAVLELLVVGETLIANYTFTDRIRYDVKGSEREMEMLQRTWWVNDHRRVYDFTQYPSAIRFASLDPGLKYARMLAIQGIDALNRHFAAVAAEVASTVRAEQPIADDAVARFAARAGGH